MSSLIISDLVIVREVYIETKGEIFANTDR